MNQDQKVNWKKQTYVIGATAGALVGLISAYLFSRAAEENAPALRSTNKPRVPTGEMLRVGLAALTVVRQIAEMGSNSQKPVK